MAEELQRKIGKGRKGTKGTKRRGRLGGVGSTCGEWGGCGRRPFFMSSPSATMLQKLTFLVLLGILGCLVVIIAQNRRSSQTEEVQGTEEVAAPEASAEAEPVVTEAPARRPV